MYEKNEKNPLAMMMSEEKKLELGQIAQRMAAHRDSVLGAMRQAGLSEQEAAIAASTIAQMRIGEEAVAVFNRVVQDNLASMLTAPVEVKDEKNMRFLALGDVRIRCDGRDPEGSFKSAVTRALLSRCDKATLNVFHEIPSLPGMEPVSGPPSAAERLSSAMPELWKSALTKLRRASAIASLQSAANGIKNSWVAASGISKADFMAMFDQAWDRAVLQEVHEEDGKESYYEEGAEDCL